MQTVQSTVLTQGAPAPEMPVPPEFRAARIDRMTEAELIGLLKNPKSTDFERAKGCQRLALIGTAAAVPALAALLADARWAHYARWGLEGIRGPAADDALRGALPKLKGGPLAGVLSTIGKRRDAKAVASVARLLYDPDTEVAQAAAAALGSIGGAEAAAALQEALVKTKGAVRLAAANGSLVCAEGLLEQGEWDRALSLYGVLSQAGIPKPVRLAAMHAIIAAETSTNRPR